MSCRPVLASSDIVFASLQICAQVVSQITKERGDPANIKDIFRALPEIARLELVYRLFAAF